MKTRLTTVAACQVAGIDRQRFNEFVSGGDYACAPETVPGRSRLFDLIDLIGLFVFAREVEAGVRPFNAGVLACSVISSLREQEDLGWSPDEYRVQLARAITKGPRYTGVGPDVQANKLVVGGLDAFEIRDFNIAAIRAIVERGIAEEQSIIGPDD